MDSKINDLQKELLRSERELNDAIRNILEKGTIEQKVELLVSDYKQRMANEEFKRIQEVQMSLLYNSLGVYEPMQLLSRSDLEDKNNELED